MPTKRQNKVSRLIQRELGTQFQRESKNLYGGAIITVTVVRVTADLGLARVYLSLYPNNKKEEILGEIKHNAKHVRYELGQKIRHQLKKIPELEFYVDDSLDYIEHIEDLLS